MLPDSDSWPPAARSVRLTTVVGLGLAVTFGLCFATGLYSHLLKNPVRLGGDGVAPVGPAWSYALTQGVHVTSGLVAVGLLAVKLWSVAPKFWRRPRLAGLVDGLERLSVLVLVASAVFQLTTGLMNVAHVYAFDFYFPPVHFAVAWIAVGAIVLHVAVQLPMIRRALSGGSEDASPDGPLLTRRGVLGVTGLGALLTVLLTAGDKVPALSPVSALAQRTGRGPQGLPVNGTAAGAQITPAVTGDDWRLEIAGRARTVRLSLPELQALPQRRARLPIACVEGWSSTADWEGVALSDLLALVGEPPSWLTVISLDQGPYGRSPVSATLAAASDTLVALRVNGQPLDLDHGYPARLIAPGRPGELQTKWLRRIELA